MQTISIHNQGWVDRFFLTESLLNKSGTRILIRCSYIASCVIFAYDYSNFFQYTARHNSANISVQFLPFPRKLNASGNAVSPYQQLPSFSYATLHLSNWSSLFVCVIKPTQSTFHQLQLRGVFYPNVVAVVRARISLCSTLLSFSCQFSYENCIITSEPLS